MCYEKGCCGSLREERDDGRMAVGRATNSAWELGRAENGFRESFLENVTHSLETILKSFQKTRVGERCSLQKG